MREELFLIQRPLLKSTGRQVVYNSSVSGWLVGWLVGSALVWPEAPHEISSLLKYSAEQQ